MQCNPYQLQEYRYSFQYQKHYLYLELEYLNKIIV